MKTKILLAFFLGMLTTAAFADDQRNLNPSGNKLMMDPTDAEAPDNNLYDRDPNSVNRSFDKSGDVFQDKESNN